MLRRFVFVLGISTILACGCMYSVYPPLAVSDYTTDMDLSGTWQMSADSPDKRLIQKFHADGFEDGAQYDLVALNNEFVVQIGKIGEHRYAQMSLLDLAPDAPPLLTAIPVYAVARIEVKDETLQVYRLDAQKSRTILEKNKVPFLTYKPSDQVEFLVLTQPAGKIKELIAKHGTKLFTDMPMIFERIAKTADVEVD